MKPWQEELYRLSRQSISRIPLSSGLMPLELSTKEACNGSSAIVGCLPRSTEKGENFEAALEKVDLLTSITKIFSFLKVASELVYMHRLRP